MKSGNYFKPVLFGLAILLSLSCYGQGQATLPIGTMPMLFNSSFAGEAEALRLNTAFTYHHETTNSDLYRRQGTGYHVSLDKFIPAIKSGIGFSVSTRTDFFKERMSVNEDFIIGSRQKVFSALGAIAPKFSIKGKYTLSPSLDIKYVKVDNYTPKSNWLQSRIGLLFNTQKYYIGYAAHLIQLSWDKGGSLLQDPYLWSYLQAGYTFQRSSESKFSFTPQFVYFLNEQDLREGEISIFPNLTFRYSQFLAGINHTGIHLGYQNEKLRIMLSSRPWRGSVPWGWRTHGDSGPFSSGNMAVRHIFKD